jgi:hypothetical protein
MAIEIGTDAVTGQRTVTFAIPDDEDDTVVSVVGSFNNWQPGVHALARRDDGRLAVVLYLEALDTDDDLHFRYLRTGGVWFDDDEDDDITPFGSVIRAQRLLIAVVPNEADAPPQPEAAQESPSAPSGQPASSLV